MFVTTMRIARISDLRRGHLSAGFVPWLRVGSFPRSDSAGCTIVTIERPSPDRLSARPLHMCALRALGFLPSRVFVLYRGNDHIQVYSTKNRAVFDTG